jgi:general secretion pathway protein E
LTGRDPLGVIYVQRTQVLPHERNVFGSQILAMVDPSDDFAADAMRLWLGVPVVRQQVSEAQFRQLLAGRYPEEALQRADTASSAQVAELDADTADEGDAPAIRFIRSALSEARERGASDIHLTAGPGRAEMNFRIGGDLVAMPPPPYELLPNIISRLKVLANLDISERRLPQDGRIRLKVNGAPLDIRIATMPHVHGEGAVLRLLGRELSVSSLNDLGFSADLVARLRKLLARHDGLFLATGPTGSGKTTTLHAALHELMRPGINIVTVEDPVEYRIDAIKQVQVEEKIGLTFPVVLRSLLRQDPDVILLGEIRDGETARIAIQAALTGHLVLATLHTNSALGAVSRLIDMGVEPFMLGAVLRGAMAQRLVRRPEGGAARVSIGELVAFDEVLTALVARGDAAAAIADRLVAQGHESIHADASRRVAAGELTEADVAAVLHDD